MFFNKSKQNMFLYLSKALFSTCFCKWISLENSTSEFIGGNLVVSGGGWQNAIRSNDI